MFTKYFTSFIRYNSTYHSKLLGNNYKMVSGYFAIFPIKKRLELIMFVDQFGV